MNLTNKKEVLLPIHPSVLSSLPVFCTVVKHGSFSAAAKELNITQSAVSHRIKQLEEILGLSLIMRSTRFLEITESGQRLAIASANAISDIERAIDGIRRTNDDGPLNISVLSSLASKWLLPHLQGYNQRYPQQTISVLADERLVDLRRENIDGAIRFTEAVDPDLDGTFLCGDWFVPVASPSLQLEADIMNCPEKLANYPLLLDIVSQRTDLDNSWEHWYKFQNIKIDKTLEGQKFNRADIVLQATMAGHGLAIARASLIEADMVEAGLLRQVGKAIPSQKSYYFACLPENAQKPAIVSFRNWLKEEMEKTFENVSQALIT